MSTIATLPLVTASLILGLMQQRRTFRFKAQHRWLQHHPYLRQHIGLPEVPNRTTLSRHGAVQDLENHEATRLRWGYSTSETLTEHSTSTPVRHLSMGFRAAEALTLRR